MSKSPKLTLSESFNLTLTRSLPAFMLDPPLPPPILTSMKSDSVPEILSNTAFGFKLLNLKRMSCACVGENNLAATGDPLLDLFVNSYTLASPKSMYGASRDA